MGIIEDIESMREEGRSEEEIGEALAQRGLSEEEINSKMSQTEIRDAVSGDDESLENPRIGSVLNTKNLPNGNINRGFEMNDINPNTQNQATEEFQEMQPSIMNQQPEQTAQTYDYDQYNSQFQQYQPSGLGSDTVTEIAEQIVAEKTSIINDKIEKIISSKNTSENKIESIDERLKRLEKIIDHLQLSILQKVGEYVNNVDDIKREIVETQKSFKTLISKKKEH